MKSLVSISLALLCTLPLRADEKEDLVIEVPAAVKATLLREAGPAGKVIELRRENAEGRVRYEAVLRIDGREYKADVDAQGELHHLELRDENAEHTRMTIDKLPPVVRSLFAKLADEKSIKELQHNKPTYEFEAITNGRKYRFLTDDYGRLLKKERRNETE
jgi:uncharacterized membrane protein YkoI